MIVETRLRGEISFALLRVSLVLNNFNLVRAEISCD